MKLLKIIISLFTMVLVGHAYAEATQEQVKEAEQLSQRTYIGLIGDHKQIGLTKTIKTEISEYYHERLLQRNRTCGFLKNFECHYKEERKTYRTLTEYQEFLIKAKKEKIDLRKLPPIKNLQLKYEAK